LGQRGLDRSGGRAATRRTSRGRLKANTSRLLRRVDFLYDHANDGSLACTKAMKSGILVIGHGRNGYGSRSQHPDFDGWRNRYREAHHEDSRATATACAWPARSEFMRPRRRRIEIFLPRHWVAASASSLGLHRYDVGACGGLASTPCVVARTEFCSSSGWHRT
jgi:hypothetical protein